jgi:hypothetical protein
MLQCQDIKKLPEYSSTDTPEARHGKKSRKDLILLLI